MKIEIYFTNRNLIRGGSPFSQVQGISGKSYAKAQLSKEGYHVSDPITPAQYEACIEDVSRAWEKPNRKWIPMFRVVEEKANTLATEWPQIETHSGAAAFKRPEKELEITITEPPKLSTNVDNSTETALQKMPFFSLKKLARDKGIPDQATKALYIQEILAKN